MSIIYIFCYYKPPTFTEFVGRTDNNYQVIGTYLCTREGIILMSRNCGVGLNLTFALSSLSFFSIFFLTAMISIPFMIDFFNLFLTFEYHLGLLTFLDSISMPLFH